jgi:hypothetical protein
LLPPLDLLHLLQRIERDFGRQRSVHWGPRTLDLDLLLYDEVRLDTPELTLPHPRLAFRRFVLEPAAEIAGDALHPSAGCTLSQLLDHLNNATHYIALASACWFAKQYVATSVAAALHAGGLKMKVASGRGLTVLGAPPIDDAEHSFTEHYCDLVERLGAELRHPLGETPGAWLISGYCAEELRLGARLWFTGAAQTAAEAAWEAAFATVPQPKLLVYLATPDDLLLFRGSEPGHHAQYLEQARHMAEQRDALDEHMQSLRGIPLLKLSAAAPEAAIREVTAAVLAML